MAPEMVSPEAVSRTQELSMPTSFPLNRLYCSRILSRDFAASLAIRRLLETSSSSNCIPNAENDARVVAGRSTAFCARNSPAERSSKRSSVTDS